MTIEKIYNLKFTKKKKKYFSTNQQRKTFNKWQVTAKWGLISTFMAEHCPFISLDPFDTYIYIYMYIYVWTNNSLIERVGSQFGISFFQTSSFHHPEKCRLELLKFFLFRPRGSKTRIISVNSRFHSGSIDRSFLTLIPFSSHFGVYETLWLLFWFDQVTWILMLFLLAAHRSRKAALLQVGFCCTILVTLF